jgi:hypothetical protein
VWPRTIRRALGLETAFWVLTVANVLPLVLGERLPFTDWPEHVAVTASIRHWFDPSFRIAEHYVVNVGRSQYLLYHFASAALSLLVNDVEVANRVLVVGAGVALPLAFRTLLCELGRDERLCVFAFPLFWNRALVLGFLPYVVSMPVLVWALALSVRHARSPRTAFSPALAVLAVVCFYLHASAYALLAFTAIVTTFACEWSAVLRAFRQRLPGELLRLAGHRLRQVSWLAPSAALAVTWMVVGRLTLRGSSLADAGEVGHIALARTAYGFELWAHDIWTSSWDEACAVVYWSAFAWIVLSRLAPSRTHEPAPGPIVYVPFACVLLFFFAMPFRLGGATMLNVRLAPLVALLAVPLLAPARGRGARAPLALAAVAALAVPLVSAIEIRRVDREEMVDLDSLFAPARPGARLATLNFRRRSPRTHFPPWVHVGAYYRARKGGVASWSFTELPHWSLHYQPGAAPPRHRPFWEFDPCVFRNAEDGSYYDYVLVRGDVDPFRDQPPGPAWRPIARARDFTLFEKTADQWQPWTERDEGPCVDRRQAHGE